MTGRLPLMRKVQITGVSKGVQKIAIHSFMASFSKKIAANSCAPTAKIKKTP